MIYYKFNGDLTGSMENYKKTYVSLDLREYLFWIVEKVLLLVIGTVITGGGVTLAGGAGW